MPGFLYHFACSEYILKNRLDLQDSANREAFLLGSLIPDLARDKEQSHFRQLHASGWEVPDLNQAKRLLFSRLSPLLLGCYCHIFLDHYFITTHLSKRYILVFNGRVIDFYHDRIYESNVFLSSKGLYGAYSAGNALLVKDNLLPDNFLDLPEKVPFTGVPVFDDRNKRNWRQEVKHYLSSPKQGNFDTFTPKELEEITLKGAELFLNEIEKLQF